MRIALVHDYLTQYGGAERVLDVLKELYPDAPVFTSVVDLNELPDHYR
ncbi:MAG: glycosyltransferase family 4 protein, partial [Thermomicrobiales bacterium]|nr:glycosyltransferase family 4 protein [Thermomicrobiales bacterium]